MLKEEKKGNDNMDYVNDGDKEDEKKKKREGGATFIEIQNYSL